MKNVLDSIAVSLNNEKVYLQVCKTDLENEDDWPSWAQAHNHKVYELSLLIGGECRINVEGQSLTLSSGQAIMIAPEQYHETHALTEPFERLTFFFMPDETAQSMRAVLGEKIKGFRVLTATPETLHTVKQILRDAREEAPYWREKRKALLTNITIDIFRQLELTNKECHNGNEDYSRLFLCDAYFSGITQKSPKQLAQFLQMSERQMNRCLMEFYGMSFQQKLVQSRMERAAWLLRTTDKNVSQIAQEIGYDTESGFFKEFRKRYGMTPMQYRRECASAD